MKTPVAIMIAVAVATLGCDDPDLVGELEENEEILEIEAPGQDEDDNQRRRAAAWLVLKSAYVTHTSEGVTTR